MNWICSLLHSIWDWFARPENYNPLAAVGTVLSTAFAAIAAGLSFKSIRETNKEKQEERDRSKPTFQYAALGVNRISRPVSDVEITLILSNLRNRPIEKYRYAFFVTDDDFPEDAPHDSFLETRGFGTTGNIEIRERYYDWRNAFTTKYPYHDKMPLKLKHLLFLIEFIDVYGLTSKQVFYLPIREAAEYQSKLSYSTVIANDGTTLTFNVMSEFPSKFQYKIRHTLTSPEIISMGKMFNLKLGITKWQIIRLNTIKLKRITKEYAIRFKNYLFPRHNKPER